MFCPGGNFVQQGQMLKVTQIGEGYMWTEVQPSVICCASAAPYRDSLTCCGPGWPCCVLLADEPSPSQSETASSAGLSDASACSGSPPAEQVHRHVMNRNIQVKERQ